MNVNQLLTMIFRTLSRQLMNLGITRGIDYASRKIKPNDEAGKQAGRPSKEARELARRAKQATRIIRRFGR